MRFTDEHDSFRGAVRSFVRAEIDPHADAWERDGKIPLHDLFRKAGDLGLLGLEYHEAYGGTAVDHGFTLVACEELGRARAAGPALALGVQMMMATPSLHRFGSEELKQRYLAPAIAGSAVSAIAVTEPDAGSDVAGLRTKAVRDGDDWVITGSKMFITNGSQADWLCLLARTSPEGGHRGMSQIIVPTDVEGFRVVKVLDKLGNRSSDTTELVFDEVRVPVANTVGEIGRGFQQQMQQFVVERMFVAYQAVGQMDHALERTRQYLRERSAFGRPLSERQHLAFRLTELQARVDMLRSHNLQTCEAIMAGKDVTRQASVAKLMTGRLLRDVADACVQYHGGFGYMEEGWPARFLRDARLASIGGGADEVMLQVLARMDGFDF